jgi:hypothetical protein
MFGNDKETKIENGTPMSKREWDSLTAEEQQRWLDNVKKKRRRESDGKKKSSSSWF